jgi:chromosomal replication initiator protein
LPAGPGKEALAQWQAALSELELQMTKATFNTWLKPVRLLAWESNGDSDARTRVVLSTPNEYVKDWLENRLCTPIRRTLSGIAGNAVELEFEVCDQFAGQGLPLLDR